MQLSHTLQLILTGCSALIDESPSRSCDKFTRGFHFAFPPWTRSRWQSSIPHGSYFIGQIQQNIRLQKPSDI